MINRINNMVTNRIKTKNRGGRMHGLELQLEVELKV